MGYDIENSGPGIYPLTLPQRDIYYDQLLHPDSSLYTIGAKVRIEGELVPEILQETFERVYREVDILNCMIIREGDEPYLKVMHGMPVKIEMRSFRGAGDPCGAAEAFMADRFREPFRMDSGEPLFRIWLLRTAGEEYYLFSTFHHLIIDGWGTSLLYTRLTEVYHYLLTGMDPVGAPLQYSGYVEFDRRYRESAQFREDEAYWRKKLSGVMGGKAEAWPEQEMELAIKEAVNRKVNCTISRVLLISLQAYGKRSKTSVFHILIAVIYRLLASIRPVPGLTFGLPLLNRPNAALKRTIGLFTTVTPLWIGDTLDVTFEELLAGIARSLKESYRHQSFPMREMLFEPGPGQDMLPPLYDIFVSYEKHNYSADLAGCRCRVMPIANAMSRSPVNIYIREFDEENDIQVDLNYNPALFPDHFMQRFDEYFTRCLEQVPESGSKALQEISYLGQQERWELTAGVNNTKYVFPDYSFLRRFMEVADRYADQTAVGCQGRDISYRELKRRMIRISDKLREEGGEGGPVLIGLMTARTEWMPAYICGIFGAGFGFVPLDPLLPAARIGHIVRDSKMAFCLADKKFSMLLPSGTRLITTEDVRAFAEDPAGDGRGRDQERQLKEGNIAYTIYTSGSTGQPKGVEIGHHSLGNLLNSMERELGVGPGESYLAVTSLSFDISMLELLLPLYTGGKVILADDEERMDTSRLAGLIERTRPGFIQATPGMWMLLLDMAKGLFGNTVALCGGEHLPLTLARRLAENCRAAYNMYGPTETTIWSTMARIGSGEVLIGKPISNTYTYILNYAGELMPVGVVGELFIGGDGVARGYCNNPALTADRFLPNPFIRGDRYYRTGDFCVRMPDGNIKYIGRMDKQVKIRGYRVELEEIEGAFLRHPGVKEAVVVARKSKNGLKSLYAYVTLRERIPDVVLLEHVRNILPGYMVPSGLGVLSEFPRTFNGKVDREKLAGMEDAIVEEGGVRTGEDVTGGYITGIWEEILGRKVKHADQSFFSMGGDSIKALQLLSRIRRDLSIDLEANSLFRYPTISRFSRMVAEEKEQIKKLIPVTGRMDSYPVSFAQRRIWLAHQQEGGGPAYTIKQAFRISGKLDLAAFSYAVREMVASNVVLRSGYRPVEGELRQFEPADIPEVVESRDLREEADPVSACRAYIDSRSGLEFDLSAPPLLRIFLAQTGDDEVILLLVVHHILADGWSIRLMTDQIIQNYRHYLFEEPVAVRSKRIEYHDYAIWHHDRVRSDDGKRQREFWKGLLGRVPEEFRFPYDHPAPQKRRFAGGTLEFEVSGEATERLEVLAAENSVTLHAVLFTLFCVVLQKFCGQNRLVAGIAMAGRESVGTEDLMGVFVNFVPFISECREEDTLLDMVRRTFDDILGMSEHQSYPIEEIDDIRPDHQAGRLLYDAALIYHRDADRRSLEEALRGLGLQWSPYSVRRDTSTLGLKLDVHHSGGGVDVHHSGGGVDVHHSGGGAPLRCCFEYDSDRLNIQTVNLVREAWLKAISLFGDQPGCKVREANVLEPGVAEGLAVRRAGMARADRDLTGVRLHVMSSFVAEPLDPYLRRAGEMAGLAVTMRYSYLQRVMEDLYGEEGSEDRVLAIRFEDWIREGDGSDKERIGLIEGVFGEISRILKSRADAVGYLYCICPMDDPIFSAPVRDYLTQLYSRWKEFLTEELKAEVILLKETAGYFKIGRLLEPVSNRYGHIPYSEEFYAMMAAVVVRKLHSRYVPVVKVIAVDCDNTLWEGVCGEMPPEEIVLHERHLLLQRYLVQKYEEGFLLAVVSKNEEADVRRVFGKKSGMILKPDMVSGWKVNWKNKSENLTELARELNVELSRILFFDDSPVECLEVVTHVSGPVVFQMPDTDVAVRSLLYHQWATDTTTRTLEDKIRNHWYRVEKERAGILQTSLSFDRYLEQLGLKVMVNSGPEFDYERMSQLTYRTTQFNLSNKKRSPDQLRELIASGHRCWTLRVSDRFGDYGTVGLVIGADRGEILEVDSWLLSCRSLGRKVENCVLVMLREHCRANGLNEICMPFRATERNGLIRAFLEGVTGEAGGSGDHRLFKLKVAAIVDVPGVDIRYQEDPVEGARPKPAMTGGGAAAALWGGVGSGINFRKDSDPIRVFWEEGRLTGAFGKYQRLLGLFDPGLLVKEEKGHSLYPGDGTSEYSLVNLVTSIFYNHIKAARRPDPDINFFSLGGNSLVSTRLLSKIYEVFGVEMSLAAFFEKPTLGSLMEVIYRSKGFDATQGNRGGMAAADRADVYPGSFLHTMVIRCEGHADRGLWERAYLDLITQKEVVIAHPSPGLIFFDFNGSEDPFGKFGQIKEKWHYPAFDPGGGGLKVALVRLTMEQSYILIAAGDYVTDRFSLKIIAERLWGFYLHGSTGAINGSGIIHPGYRIAAASNYGWSYPNDRHRFDWPGSTEIVYRGKELSALWDLALDGAASLLDVLVASAAAFFEMVAGGKELEVETMVNGREHAVLHEQIGVLEANLVIRLAAGEGNSFREFVKGVRGQLLEAYCRVVGRDTAEAVGRDDGARCGVSGPDISVVLQDGCVFRPGAGLRLTQLEQKGAYKSGDFHFEWISTADQLKLVIYRNPDCDDLALYDRIVEQYPGFLSWLSANPVLGATEYEVSRPAQLFDQIDFAF